MKYNNMYKYILYEKFGMELVEKLVLELSFIFI